MHPLLEEMLYESEYFNNRNEIIFIDTDEENEYEEDDDEEEEEDPYSYDVNESYLYYDEEDFIDSEKVHLKYYIGLPGYIRKYNEFVLLCGISSRTFYKYDIHNITQYLSDSSVSYVQNPKVQILQLIINTNGVHNVVIKTHWLRLVQRTWKNVLKKRREYIRKIKMVKNLHLREINGKIGEVYPTIHGMLHSLKLYECK